VKWIQLKGRAFPHIQVSCDAEHSFDVVLSGRGRSGEIQSVWIHGPSVAPSGLGVGSSYRALSELTDDLVCRGIKARSARSASFGVIERPHTLCTDPHFPKVAYVFENVVFKTGERPENADTLRIHSLRWRP